MTQFGYKLNVVAVGKIKARHWQTAQDDYAQRLKHYARFQLVEVKDLVGRGFPDEEAMAREGELLLDAAAPFDRFYVLHAEGDTLTSPGLATFIEREMALYPGGLALLIGGPLGFADEVIEKAHGRLSLSPMTLPHELARVVLLEQLYRAFTILSNEPYHK